MPWPQCSHFQRSDRDTQPPQYRTITVNKKTCLGAFPLQLEVNLLQAASDLGEGQRRSSLSQIQGFIYLLLWKTPSGHTDNSGAF